MCEVADRHLCLFIDVRPEWPLVIDAESEDAVLVRQAEGCAEKSAVGSCRGGLEVQTVKRREHGELELEGVVGGNRQRLQVIVIVRRHFNGERLTMRLAWREGLAEWLTCVPHRS